MLNISGENTPQPLFNGSSNSDSESLPPGAKSGHASKFWPLLHSVLAFTTLLLGVSCVPATDVSKLPIPTASSVTATQSTQVGALSEDLLGGARYDSLVLELQPMGNAQLSQEAINHVRSFLLEVLSWKSEQLRITQNPALFNYADPESQEGRISVQWARTIEKRVRRTQALLNRGSLFVLISDSRSSDDTDTARTFGLSHRSSSIILYHPTILENSGTEATPQRWRLEAAVLEHELGHLLGLVNSNREKKSANAGQNTHGDPDQDPDHESKESPTHCSNPACLMHANTIRALEEARTRESDGMPVLCLNCSTSLLLIRNSKSPTL